MVIGLTRARVVQGLRVNIVIGLVAMALGVVAVFVDDGKAQHATGLDLYLSVLLLFVMPSAIWLLLAVILGSVTLRVDGSSVEQVLWNRFVLKRRPVAALSRISAGSFSALVLHFRGGGRIALPGIHHDDQVRFVSFLQDLTQHHGFLHAGVVTGVVRDHPELAD